LEEQNSWWKMIELELVENELCHYQEAVLPYAKENARLKGLRDTLEGETPSR
jgi:hypothetical protein